MLRVQINANSGLQKVFSPDASVGFVAHALKYGNAAGTGQVLAPARIEQGPERNLEPVAEIWTG
jgi:hypothetical protein